jgi:hypothetical protein
LFNKFLVLLSFPFFLCLSNNPRPIQFCIPESKIVNDIPKKTQDCATVIPRYQDTYVFSKESDYYDDYKRSYYGVTCKKRGWDCLRHYEILANGCIPFLVGLGECPDKNMVFLPKELIKQRYGAKIVDVIKVPHIYKSYQEDVSALYGKGMTYTRILDDLMIDRTNTPERIKNREFEFIIYGSCHRGLPFFNLVRSIYPKEKIIYICGEDFHKCTFRNQPNLFLREFLSG